MNIMNVKDPAKQSKNEKSSTIKTFLWPAFPCISCQQTIMTQHCDLLFCITCHAPEYIHLIAALIPILSSDNYEIKGLKT